MLVSNEKTNKKQIENLKEYTESKCFSDRFGFLIGNFGKFAFLFFYTWINILNYLGSVNANFILRRSICLLLVESIYWLVFLFVIGKINKLLFGQTFDRFLISFIDSFSFVKPKPLLLDILLFTELFDVGVAAH